MRISKTERQQTTTSYQVTLTITELQEAVANYLRDDPSGRPELRRALESNPSLRMEMTVKSANYNCSKASRLDQVEDVLEVEFTTEALTEKYV